MSASPLAAVLFSALPTLVLSITHIAPSKPAHQGSEHNFSGVCLYCTAAHLLAAT